MRAFSSSMVLFPSSFTIASTFTLPFSPSLWLKGALLLGRARALCPHANSMPPRSEHALAVRAGRRSARGALGGRFWGTATLA